MQSSVSHTLTSTTTIHCFLFFGHSPTSSNYGLLSTLELMVESVFYEIVLGLQQLQLQRQLGQMATLGWSLKAFLSIGSCTIPPG